MLRFLQLSIRTHCRVDDHEAGIADTTRPPQTDHADVTPSKSFAAQHTMGQHLKAKGIPNFGQVTPTLYRGGQPSAEGFEKLAHMGIDIVVDTGRSKRDQTLIKSLGMAYVSLPWYCPFPKDEVFRAVYKSHARKSGQENLRALPAGR